MGREKEINIIKPKTIKLRKYPLRLNYAKVDPSGNTTVFILDPFPRHLHPELASKIMKSSYLGAEQVGFVEQASSSEAVARLQMMGGEFCGNAARGFAAWLADRQYPGILYHEESQDREVLFEISGHNKILKAMVRMMDPAQKQSRVELSMPLPEWIEHIRNSENQHYTLVGFEGIVHVVMWHAMPSEDHFFQMKKEMSDRLGPLDCLGVMYFNEKEQLLTPVVYVRQVESVVWESSCGSGSVAVAAALSDLKGKSIDYFSLKQPGGDLEVCVHWDGKIREVKIRGNVNIRSEGQAYL